MNIATAAAFPPYHPPEPGRRLPRFVLAAAITMLTIGCGSAPDVSATKASELSDAFNAYAGAVERVEARWVDGLTAEESDATLADLGTIRESLKADASNIKIDATVQRLERLGTALGSIPNPFTRTAGAVLGLLAAGITFFGRKKVNR